ncbi:hypothetical protein [Cryptosporangium japonicum]|uniref:Protein kinase domain-containing protein n=1 Tax=Cryptosporangium japonicum TaxID=80872 RepID=A0ABP3EP37_9ACTN
MRAPSYPPVIDLHELGVLPPEADFDGGGQSRGIWRLPDDRQTLFKRYNAQGPQNADTGQLDRLIAQPGALPETDRILVSVATAWPVSRVVDGAQTVGVLIPEAPDDLKVVWFSPQARKEPQRYDRLPIDYLAKPDTFLSKRLIRSQSPADRLDVCGWIVQLAALFERLGIVYADWSYSNAFWHPIYQTVYLIDLDGCSYGPRKHVVTPGFDDPHTPTSRPVDTFTDRYRMALLVARCVTGLREVSDVVDAMRRVPDTWAVTLLGMLTAPDRRARPSAADLLAALRPEPAPSGSSANSGTATSSGADRSATGVVSWKPRRPATSVPVSSVPVSSPPEAPPPSTPGSPAGASWPTPPSSAPMTTPGAAAPRPPSKSQLVVGCGAFLLALALLVFIGLCSAKSLF